MRLSPATLLLPLLALTPDGATASRPRNAVDLTKVRSLTLRANTKTSHRRVPAIPQLKCVSASQLCALHAVDVMRCTNEGTSYGDADVQWSCTAELPEELRLGGTEVICEGYDSPDDPFVLKGSCGVEYRLVLTEKGERRYPEIARSRWGGGTGWNWDSVLFMVVFVGVLGWIVWSACVNGDQNRARRPAQRRFWGGDDWGGPGGWGGPGWGGGGGQDDPPPPYPGNKPGGAGGWQPGFWSGLAGGAAAGYMAGNRGGFSSGRRDRDEGRRRFGGYEGYGGGYQRGESSSSGSGARYESTGFGSTSRR